MRIIHTSDWHIGHRLYDFDRMAETSAILDCIISYVESAHADALLVSGDVFDTPQPSAQAQNLFASKMMDLRMRCPDLRIVVTAGNHDSATRHEAVNPLWDAVGIDMIGTVSTDNLRHNIVAIPGRGIIAAVPYVNPRFLPGDYFQRLIDEATSMKESVMQPLVLMAHLPVTGCDSSGHEADDVIIGGVETCSLPALGEGYDYLALGHIHKAQSCSPAARYCGSPMPMGFDENYDHFISVVDISCAGAEPAVESLIISSQIPLLTLPVDGPGSWDDAVAALRGLDPNQEAFVRLQVIDDGTVPPDARSRAAALCEGTGLHICVIKAVRQEVAADAGGQDGGSIDFDRMRTIAPVEIARMYAMSDGREFDSELADMFAQATANVESEKREQ
ncbi:MAG: exonuclease SbcCD subunit D [Muribaculaceae bacterium]|nr:exonuclease SbcCD subunit D [Muribaculaceae bacterium]